MSELTVESMTSDERRLLAWARFLYGLPALLIAAVAIGAVLFGHGVPESQLIKDYAAAAATALEQEQLAEADLYYRKVVSLAPFNQEHQYNLALAAERQADGKRAWGLMSKIAPETSVGYAPAHLWQALQLYEVAKTPRPPDGIADRLEHHLLATIKRLGQHDQAHMMLGQLYLAQAQVSSDAVLVEKSLSHLAAGVDSYPENRLSVADLHRRLGQTERADEEAATSLQYYSELLKADPDHVDARLRVAAAHTFLRQFGSSIKTLLEGLQSKDDPQLRKALASTYLLAARAVATTEPDNIGKRLELLQAALVLEPENEVILAHFAAITAQSGAAATQARKTLQHILEQGQAPAMVHLILGSIAMQRGEDERADYHLHQALELNSRMPEVLNNLAWHLAYADEPQLERALELADKAVALRPSQVEIRDTRGQILLKLGRHQEALKDLLLAVRKLPNRPEIHDSLAKIYEYFGDKEMADRHKSRVTTQQVD